MTNYPHPTIAREGWPFLAIALALAIGATAWCAIKVSVFMNVFNVHSPASVKVSIGGKVSATTNILAVLQGK